MRSRCRDHAIAADVRPFHAQTRQTGPLGAGTCTLDSAPLERTAAAVYSRASSGSPLYAAAAQRPFVDPPRALGSSRSADRAVDRRGRRDTIQTFSRGALRFPNDLPTLRHRAVEYVDLRGLSFSARVMANLKRVDLTGLQHAVQRLRPRRCEADAVLVPTVAGTGRRGGAMASEAPGRPHDELSRPAESYAVRGGVVRSTHERVARATAGPPARVRAIRAFCRTPGARGDRTSRDDGGWRGGLPRAYAQWNAWPRDRGGRAKTPSGGCGRVASGRRSPRAGPVTPRSLGGILSRVRRAGTAC
jgi:hypothetical protein